MLKDLTRTDWLRWLQIPEQRIPKVLILRGTRNLQSKYTAMLPYFDNVLDVGSPNGIIENVLIGDRGGVPVAFACVYGAPMASEIVHIFGTLGTGVVLQIGNCGALADDLMAGAIFVAASAYCGEGAAQYYKTDGKTVTASTELLTSPPLARFGKDNYHIGNIYTTSALFAEGDEELQRWYDQGFAAVDMETATTFAVAEFFGMKRLSILYVFDNPRQREHLLLTDSEKDARREQADDAVRELVLALAVEL